MIEKKCLLCGETYMAETEDEDHLVSSDGILCQGKGEVMGEWGKERRTK